MLLIPKRIRELKEEGRREGFEEARREAFKEGFEKARWEAFKEAFAEGFEKGRRESLREARARRRRIPRTGDDNLERLQNLVELYNSGGITEDELDAIFAARYGGGREDD